MINPSSYIIKFNKGKQNIVIPENTINEVDTPLILFGRNSENWAKYLNENFVHVLENFNNEYYPGYSNQLINGQLWFDNNNQQLKICTDTKLRSWDILCNAESPELASIVTTNNIDNYLNNYIPLDGNDIPMSNSLKLVHITDSSDNQTLATKKYVEQKSGKCGKVVDTKATKYVRIIGEANVTTKVFLEKVKTTDDNSAVNKKYIDNTVNINNTITYFDINDTYTVLETANYSKHIVETGKDTMMYINGSIIFNKYETEKSFSWIPPYSENYYCVLSGGMHNVTAGTAQSDIADDIYFEKTSTSNITIYRDTADIDETVYFTICGLFGMSLPTTTTTAAPTTQAPIVITTAPPVSSTTTEEPTTTTTELVSSTTTEEPTTTTTELVSSTTTEEPTTTTTTEEPTTTTTTTKKPTTTTTTLANGPGYIGEDAKYKYYIAPKNTEVENYWTIPDKKIKGLTGDANLSGGQGLQYTASLTDGYTNTRAVMGLGFASGITQKPAFQACGQIPGGPGYTQNDWYLPAIDEFKMIKNNKDTLTPAYQIDESAVYWSSTEAATDGTRAWTYSFTVGQASSSKVVKQSVRAIRRVPK